MISTVHAVSDEKAFYMLMGNRLHILDILLLVEGGQEGSKVLYMAETAVGECEPFDLQLAKNILDLLEKPLDDVLLACEPEVVDVFGHQTNESADPIVSLFEFQDKFSVNRGWNHPASVLSDLGELEGESSWGIRQTCAWFVTM